MSKISLNTTFSGVNKLLEWWPVVKSNFLAIVTGHNALEDRVDNIVASAGTDNTEIVDARHSSVKSTAYSTLDGRLEASEQDSAIHAADVVAHAELNDRIITVGSGKTFTTIQAAINSIKKRVEATISINVDAGTYNEVVNIHGFIGSGKITINGAAALANAYSYVVLQFSIIQCSCEVDVIGFRGTRDDAYNSPFAVAKCPCVIIDKCDSITDGKSTYAKGVGCGHGSKIIVTNCNFQNKDSAIYAEYNTDVYSENNSGSGNNIGLHSNRNSTIGKSGTQPSGTTAESAWGGGVIR